jgi:hypothetical protein
MHQTTRLYLIKLLLWIITLGRRKTIRGNYTMAKVTPNPSIRSITSLMVMEVGTHTGMEATLTEAVVATSMATSTMEDSGETTPMVTIVGTMDTTMEEMVTAVSTQMSRRTSPTSLVSSARRMDTTPPTVQITSQIMLPSPTHSRRDR